MSDVCIVESAKIDAWLNQRINVRMVKLDWPTFHKRRENLLQCLFLVLHEGYVEVRVGG